MDHLSVAEDAAWAAARAIRARWQPEGFLDAHSKGAVADVATSLDSHADAAVKAYLRSALQNPVIISEEDDAVNVRPDPGSAELWLVDPLDGSHNASIGVPLIGVTVAWTAEGAVGGAVVVDVFGDVSLGAARGGDIRIRGPLAIKPAGRRAAVALQQAYSTPRGSRSLAVTRDRLEARYARVLYTWCPVVDLILTARGHLAGWVAVELGGPEYEAIRFLAKEIGLAERQLDSDDEGVRTAHTFVIAWPKYLDGLVDAAASAIQGDLA